MRNTLSDTPLPLRGRGGEVTTHPGERPTPDESSETPRPGHGTTEGNGDADLREFAAKVGIASLIVIAIVALALALWKARIIVALIVLGITIAAAMQPGVDALRRHGVPRSVGVLLHYLAFAGALGLFLWLAVPQAIDQVQQALGGGGLTQATRHSTGIKHDILAALDRWLRDLPSGSKLAPQAFGVGKRAFEILIGLFFTLAVAAYWVLEREHAVNLVSSLIKRPRRKRLRDTWTLIDLKLGAYVRGQLVLVVFVAVLLSLAFWAIDL